MPGDESPPGITTTASGRQLKLPVGRLAQPDEDVFVSLSNTVEKLETLMADAGQKGGRIVFIRAPVGSGKSTLVDYLAEKQSDRFVKVKTGVSDEMWFKHTIIASGRTDLGDADVSTALEAIAKTGKTILIDEAHVLFAYPKVVFLLFKSSEDMKPAPKFLLFSASGSAVDSKGKTIATPGEIRQKYLWYPPQPDADQLSQDLMEAEKPVYLDSDSVRFFTKLCGGHRGIFMEAMGWVQECQDNSPDKLENTSWGIRESVSHVRRTFEDSRLGGRRAWNTGLRAAFKQSRAVRVNGEFAELGNIPAEFGLVLYGGPKRRAELNGKERDLTINGFLFPERQSTDEEFVAFDWMDPLVLYGVPNPIMAEYYGDILPLEVETYKRELVEDLKKPVSAADLIARVLPYMTLSVVVGAPISRGNKKLSDPFSAIALPYENDYNHAMAEILRNHLDYIVSTPLDEKLGKTDIVVSYEDDTTCAIKSIMAYQRPVCLML